MTRRIYAEIERVLATHPISEIHLFAAVPQALMMMLGREFKGMPPVTMYEWTGTEYVCACTVPGGVL